MIQITLPDGSKREYPGRVTVAEIAASIGTGLAKAALGGKVNGKLVDTSYTIASDSALSIVTAKDPEGLDLIRHSTAHLLAYAVKDLFPDAQVTIGPVIDNGFYYDFSYKRPFTPEDLVAIEKRMAELAAKDEQVTRRVLPRDEAVAHFKSMGELYKAEIIASIPAGEDVSLYREGAFEDLCRGPHVPSTGKLKHFKLMKVAGAYWRGDHRNEMLQRVYGTAWATKEELQQYLTMLEEAEKRDHRKLGVELDLFSFPDEIGSGLAVFHPKGGIVRAEIESYMRERLLANGYELVYSPHITKGALFETSGHLQWYEEGMFPAMHLDEERDADGQITKQGQDYYLKPMNCPFHNLIFRARGRSYRELPLRLAEFGTVYRYEKSGTLSGLTRVRGLTQDDAHIYVTPDQVKAEVASQLEFVLETLRGYGLDDFYLELSTRNPEKSVGSDELWEQATETLRQVAVDSGLELVPDPGGAAFYGPKISVQARDAIQAPFLVDDIVKTRLGQGRHLCRQDRLWRRRLYRRGGRAGSQEPQACACGAL